MPVSVKGAVNLRKALRAYTPDLAKQMSKDIAISLKPVVKAAKGFVPDDGSILSNWRTKENSKGNFPMYSSSAVKSGITFKGTPSKPNNRGFRSLARLLNKTAAGAIYETMGRKTPSSQFVENQNNKFSGEFKGKDKERGRVLFRAWDDDRGAAQKGVMKAINTASNNFKVATK